MREILTSYLPMSLEMLSNELRASRKIYGAILKASTALGAAIEKTFSRFSLPLRNEPPRA
jgi:hypothetical protein